MLCVSWIPGDVKLAKFNISFIVYEPRINFLFSSSQVKQKAREENSYVINGVGSDAHFFPFSFAPYCPSKLSINVNNRCLWKTLDFVSPKLFIFNCTLHCEIFLKLTGSLQSAKEETTFGACKLQGNSRKEPSPLMMRFHDEWPRDQIWTEFSNWSQVSSVAFTRHVREKPLAFR